MQKTKTILPLLLFVSVLAFAMIPNTMATLPMGNGVQNLNPNTHDDYWIRGHYYSLLMPDVFSGQIKVGTWLTIGMGWYQDYVPEEVLDEVIAADIEMLKAWPLGLTFDGEEIPIENCWRFDDIIIIPMEELAPEDPNAPGTYYFSIRFRYYIPPRAVGHYEIISTWMGFPWSVGYVEWVPPNQL